MIDLQIILEFLIKKTSELTGHSINEINGDTFLLDLGIDSFKAIMLCGYIEDEYQLEIEPLVMFDCKTPKEVASKVYSMITSSK